jgi:hypothetical protein
VGSGWRRQVGGEWVGEVRGGAWNGDGGLGGAIYPGRI